jgi:hypothetical protein
MLSDRTVQAEQRPKLARFGEMVRIIAPTRSSAGLTRGSTAMADQPEIYFIVADPPLAD